MASFDVLGILKPADHEPHSPWNAWTLWLTTDSEDSVEEVFDVDAGLRYHRRQLLPQLELLPDDHHSAEILQGRFSLRHRQGHTAVL